MANFHKTSSYYKNTPVKDFYLDLWVPKGIDFLPDVTDQLYTIESKFNERPDLLAAELYGNARLWWVFAMRNKDVLIDPIADFQSGLEIWIPSSSIVAGRV